MENKLRYLLFFVLGLVILGLSITLYVTHSKNEKELLECKEQSAVIESRLNDLCNAPMLGGFSINSIMCNGQRQLCVCGDPEQLNFGGPDLF